MLVHPRKQCVSVHIIYGSVVPIRLAHIIEGRRILSAVFQGIDALEPQLGRPGQDRYTGHSILSHQVAVSGGQAGPGGQLYSVCHIYESPVVRNGGGSVHQHDSSPSGQCHLIAIRPISGLERGAVCAALFAGQLRQIALMQVIEAFFALLVSAL